MILPYYPGCTLKANALHFEESAKSAMEQLGITLQEMKDWVCCGTVFSLTSDDLMLQLSSIRNLLRAQKQDLSELVVLCSMCYNTLRQSKDFVERDPANLEKINNFMYMEGAKYEKSVRISHLLSVLRDRFGLIELTKNVSNPLKSLKIGAYYGCLLVRPPDYAIDDFEDPTIMEDLIATLGGQPVDYLFKLECCGAYQTLTKKDISIKRAYEILDSAGKAGCEAIMTSCPLCAYNLDFLQNEIEQQFMEFQKLPVFYFTELISIALNKNWNHNWAAKHAVDPEPLLKEKQLI
jgi:heterodisulfide reductase subunit B